MEEVSVIVEQMTKVGMMKSFLGIYLARNTLRSTRHSEEVMEYPSATSD